MQQYSNFSLIMIQPSFLTPVDAYADAADEYHGHADADAADDYHADADPHYPQVDQEPVFLPHSCTFFCGTAAAVSKGQLTN